MTRARGPQSALVAVFAVAGGLVFAAALGLGVVAYVVWFGIVAGPWAWASGLSAVGVDAILFTGFALHHSIFARTGVRHWVAARVSPALERTVYVWIASVLFGALCWAWQLVPGLLWRVPAPWSLPLAASQVAGVWISLHAARQLDVLDLSGLRPALARDRPPAPVLIRRGLYALVRHPIYLGWVLMVWPTPAMTGTRLAFAALSTFYLVVAIPFEERTLRRDLGPEYDTYARDVRWRMVPFVY